MFSSAWTSVRGKSNKTAKKHRQAPEQANEPAVFDPVPEVIDSIRRGEIVIVTDDERRENAHGLLMSLNMLIETSGGFDYSGADCKSWMREVGFRNMAVEHLQGPYSMVVGYKS